MEESTEEPVGLVERVCAIDIGKAGLVVCVRVPHESKPGRRVQEVREYATTTPALLAWPTGCTTSGSSWSPWRPRDAHRFPGPAQLCSWAGLTPRHYESDTKVHRGRITKQGSTLVRWAAVEAVQRVRSGHLGGVRARIGERRGANVAKVAAARKLLTLVYYGLHDGHIRCLARPA
jgi:transposase